jgi:hypothetical protein
MSKKAATSSAAGVVTLTEIDDLASTDPDALALLVLLRQHHWGGLEFALGKAMAEKLGWTLPRFRNARARLEADYIICVRPGGRGQHDPPVYRLRGAKSRLNNN